MTLQLVTLQEDERHRISQDLHDDIGQGMTALVLGLKAIDEAVTAGEKDVGQHIKDAVRSVEAIMKQVRQVFYRPSPSLDAMPPPRQWNFCRTLGNSRLHVFNSETLPDDRPSGNGIVSPGPGGLNNTKTHTCDFIMGQPRLFGW
jgi:hypothetical protein